MQQHLLNGWRCICCSAILTITSVILVTATTAKTIVIVTVVVVVVIFINTPILRMRGFLLVLALGLRFELL